MMAALFMILLGLGSGVVIAAGVFAFITIIGVIPRLTQKTGTERHAKLYEEVIVAGGVTGCLLDFFSPEINIGVFWLIPPCIAAGIFFGILAVCLAETLDVIPVLSRRIGMRRGIKAVIFALAFGKLFGSLLYFVVPGFFEF